MRAPSYEAAREAWCRRRDLADPLSVSPVRITLYYRQARTSHVCPPSIGHFRGVGCNGGATSSILQTLVLTPWPDPIVNR